MSVSFEYVDQVLRNRIKIVFMVFYIYDVEFTYLENLALHIFLISKLALAVIDTFQV